MASDNSKKNNKNNEENGSKSKIRRRRSRKTTKVRIRWFGREIVTVDDIEIEVLKVIKETEIEEKGEPLDVLFNVIEKLAISGEGVFEARIEEGTIDIIGEISEDRDKERIPGVQVLYPYPSRLKRIGVVRYSDLKSIGMGVDAYNTNLDKIYFKNIKKDYYIYEGRINAPDSVYLIIIETENNRRFIRIPKQKVINKTIFSQPKTS